MPIDVRVIKLIFRVIEVTKVKFAWCGIPVTRNVLSYQLETWHRNLSRVRPDAHWLWIGHLSGHPVQKGQKSLSALYLHDYSLFTVRIARSPLVLNGKRALLTVNKLQKQSTRNVVHRSGWWFTSSPARLLGNLQWASRTSCSDFYFAHPFRDDGHIMPCLVVLLLHLVTVWYQLAW